MNEGAVALGVLVACVLVLLAAFAVGATARFGLPSLLVFVVIGVLVGRTAVAEPLRDPHLVRELGFLALAVILAEGGLTTPWRDVRSALPAAVPLATVGVLVSAGITAAAARLLLGLPWQLALLLGAVLSPTDAAATFATLRRVPLTPRMVRTLEAESGLNDPLAVILVVTLSVSSLTAPLFAGRALRQLAVGLAVGWVVGELSGVVLRRFRLPVAGLHSIAVLAALGVGYGLAAVSGGSPFLAVYVAAVALDVDRLAYRAATLSFAGAFAWLAQIGLFVLLGVLASPVRLLRAAPAAVLVGVVLALVARPVSVWLSTPFTRLSWREKLFLSWGALRGAVPIVLATVPATAGTPGSERVFDVAFVLVVLFTAVQAPTLPWAARALRVAAPGRAREIYIDVAQLDDVPTDVLQVTVPPRSHVNGAEVWQLRLPAAVVVSLVVRDGVAFVPDRWTRLVVGDRLLVVAPRALREEAERRLAVVHDAGPLANWLRQP